MFIDGFLSSSEQLTGIFDNDTYEQLFVDAICTSINISDNSELMTHPLEDGSKTADHQVFDLIKISMILQLSKANYNIVFENIDTAYRSSTLLTIQTKVNVYKNMLIESKPHVESSKSGIIINLDLMQFNVLSTNTIYNAKFDEDKSTSKKGIQNGVAVSSQQQSTILQKIVGVVA
jgi:hypothetical protein